MVAARLLGGTDHRCLWSVFSAGSGPDRRQKPIVCPTDSSVRRCIQANTTVTETLSIRIDAGTKKRLDALSKRSRRSKSFLAAEAIAAYVESEEWQLGELKAGIAELDSGQEVSHDKVSKWLNSWGKPGKSKVPR